MTSWTSASSRWRRRSRHRGGGVGGKPAAHSAAAITAISMSGRSTKGGSSARLTRCRSAPGRRACWTAVERQRHAGEIERHDGVASSDGSSARCTARAEHRDQRSRAQTRSSGCRAGSRAAGRAALRWVYSGNDALRGERQAEMDDVADHLQPGPGIDVDAELDAAHPARQQDLRQEDDHRAGDADDEGRAGHALGGAVLAGEPGLQRAPAGGTRMRARGRFSESVRAIFLQDHGDAWGGSPWLSRNGLTIG